VTNIIIGLLMILATICRGPSVCRLQRSCALLIRLKFSAMFLRHLVPWLSVDIHGKFYEDRPREPVRRWGGGKCKRGSQI